MNKIMFLFASFMIFTSAQVMAQEVEIVDGGNAWLKVTTYSDGKYIVSCPKSYCTEADMPNQYGGIGMAVGAKYNTEGILTEITRSQTVYTVSRIKNTVTICSQGHSGGSVN